MPRTSFKLSAAFAAAIAALFFASTGTGAYAQDSIVGYWDDQFGLEAGGGRGLGGQVISLARNPVTGEIFAGGELNPSPERLRIARWTGSEWIAVGQGTTNGIVRAFDFRSDGLLYVGGNFTGVRQADGTTVPASRVAIWDGTNWSALPGGPQASVWDIDYDEANGRLYVVGDFDAVLDASGSPINSPNITFWDGTDWNAVGQGIATRAASVNVSPGGDSVLVAGQFVFSGVNTDGSIVPLNTLGIWNGTTWSAFVAPTGSVHIVERDSSGNLYAGGSFTAIGGVSANRVARYAGGVWEAFEGGPTDGIVHTMAFAENGSGSGGGSGGGVYIGGTFKEFEQADGSPVAINRVAFYDDNLNDWLKLGEAHGPNNNINDIVVDGSDLWVGGLFQDIGSRPSNRIARWIGTPHPFATKTTQFSLDARSLVRHGTMPVSRALLLDVMSGSLGGLYYLYDDDGDSVYTAVIDQASGETVDFGYLIDPNLTAVDLGVWIRELDYPDTQRSVTIPSGGANRFDVPTVVFDDRDLTGPVPGSVATVRHRFRVGSSAGQFTFSSAARRSSYSVTSNDRPLAVDVREYRAAPTGSLPPGVERAADHLLWRIQTWPAAAVYSVDIDWEYRDISGIRDPENVRILRRDGPGSPWEIVPTEVDLDERELKTPGISDLSGEWTVGSLSGTNLLTALVPAVPSNPTPPDGAPGAANQPTLEWDAIDGAEFEVFLWPSTDPKPLGPIARPTDFDYRPSTLDANVWYNWQVNAKNLHGSSEGPTWTFRVGPAPDLVVSAVNAPTDAFSGQPLEVTWTVENIGNVGTAVPRWSDDVFLSADMVLDLSDVRLASVRNLSSLNVGDTYSADASVTLPDGIEGTYYLLVSVDDAESEFEENEENNVAFSAPITVVLTPYADLEGVEIIAPASVFSGDSIDVAWTVTNAGTGVTSASEWFDTVFLSEDDSLDYNFTSSTTEIRINETLLGRSGHIGVLDPAEDYAGSLRVKLPADAVGDYYLFVYADVAGGDKQTIAGDVYEFNQELDNWISIPISITLTPPPDLTVTSVVPPASVTSGEVVDVVWTVQNVGPGATAGEQWSDLVYYSASTPFDTSTADVLGSFAHSGALENDESYTGSGLVRVPDGVAGDGYFFVRTDWRDEVFEFTFTENNVAGNSDPIEAIRAPYPDLEVSELSVSPADLIAGDRMAVRYRVSNTGNADAPSWIDSLFVSAADVWDPAVAIPVGVVPGSASLSSGTSRTQSASVVVPTDLQGNLYLYVVADGGATQFEFPDTENNVARSAPLAVAAYPAVSLAAEFRNTSTELRSSEPFTYEFIVRNTGQARTLTTAWHDAVYISLDAQLDPAVDPVLDVIEHVGTVNGGASYTVRRTVQVPDGYEGEYRLFVVPDVDQQVIEATISRGNLAVNVTLPTPSDLRVTQVNAPGQVTASQPVDISWTVQNTGAGETGGARWYDTVYLSADTRFDLNDVVLATVERSGSLASGADYEGTARVTVPPYVSGARNILIRTDSRTEVYEHLGELNNVAVSQVEVVLPPPADLTVADVTAPVQASPGESITITWTLHNDGTNPAKGLLREAVYVSSDPDWDSGDALIGVAEREIDLDPGTAIQMRMHADLGTTYRATAAGEITDVMPGVAPGTYYAIVRTDIGGNIRETDTGNNSAAAATSTATDTPVLELGTNSAVSLSTGVARYFRLDVPQAGSDVVVSLRPAAGATDGSTSLYVRRGAVPTGAVSDASSVEPFQTNQRVVLPSTDAGTYYVVVRAENLAQDDVSFVLQADVLDFEVTSIAPSVGGNAGVITVRLEGARFEEGGHVELRDQAGTSLQAFESYVLSSTSVMARFNLNGEAVGMRDVVLVAPGGSEAILTSGFEVVAGVGAQPYVYSYYPNAVRSFGSVEVEVVVGNSGDSNAFDQFMVFGARGRFFSLSVVGKNGTGAADYGEPMEVGLVDDFPWLLDSEEPSRDTAPRFYRAENEDVLMPIWFYEIPPGSELRFRVTITHVILEGYVNHFASLIPMPESQFTQTGALEDLPTSAGYQMIVSSFVDFYNDIADDAGFAAGAGAQAGAGSSAAGAGGTAATGLAGGVPFAFAGNARQDAGEAEQSIRDGLAEMATSAAPGVGTITGGVLGAAVGGLLGAFTPLPFGAAAGAKVGGTIGLFAGGILDAYNLANSASETFGDALDTTFDPLSCAPSSGGGTGSGKAGTSHNFAANGSGGTCSSAGGQTEIRASRDPNDIIGPASYGDRNWVNADAVLLYTIRFENDPKLASAPAQVVDVRQRLDDSIDPRSFRLGRFGFANLTFDPPPNVSYYRDRLDVADSLGVYVDVTAGIDVVRNEAFWILRSIDPATGVQPATDPFAGFLPVNDSTGVGEGFLRYTVVGAEDAQTGDEIEAQASIVFDINAPIETPVVVNTIDADAPASAFAVSAVAGDTAAFQLDFSGTDVGSGFAAVRLYVSVDAGPFQLIQRGIVDSTYLLVTEPGRVYEAYTVASDHVGNREAGKSEASAITVVATEEAGRDVPDAFAIHPNYPNPFSGSTTIPIEMASDGEVEIEVFDILGRLVVRAERGRVPAGKHEHVLDLGQHASGMYFYRVTVRNGRSIRFRDSGRLVMVK